MRHLLCFFVLLVAAAVELADGPDGPVSNVVLPPDLPLDVIAEEVQRGWKNKEVHVEGLLKKVTGSWC